MCAPCSVRWGLRGLENVTPSAVWEEVMRWNTMAIATKPTCQSQLVGMTTNHRSLIDKTRKVVDTQPSLRSNPFLPLHLHPRQARERVKLREQRWGGRTRSSFFLPRPSFPSEAQLVNDSAPLRNVFSIKHPKIRVRRCYSSQCVLFIYYFPPSTPWRILCVCISCVSCVSHALSFCFLACSHLIFPSKSVHWRGTLLYCFQLDVSRLTIDFMEPVLLSHVPNGDCDGRGVLIPTIW